MYRRIIKLPRLVLNKLIKIVTPLLTKFYISNPDSCPESILYALGIATPKNRPAFYTIDRIVNSINDYDAAVIECGTYKGGTLLGIAHILKKRGINTEIYGLDSFEGFPEPTKEDALENGTLHKKAQKGYFKDVSISELNDKIRKLGFSNQIILLKGFFETTLPRLKDEKFKLVHIDCDLYHSYRICLEFLYDKVLPGGYIVFDEYDYSNPVYPGAQKAIDEFLKNKPEKREFFEQSKFPRYFIKKL